MTHPGEAGSPQRLRIVEQLRTRAAALGPAEIRARFRAAVQAFEAAVSGLTEAEARQSPRAGEWSIAQVVDHVAQTTLRGADELRHLLAGRRPPAPPVYEGLLSGAATWVPWGDLLADFRSAAAELDAHLGATVDAPPPAGAAPTVRTVLVVNRPAPPGASPLSPEVFIADLDWKEYALVQRLHLLDHRGQTLQIRRSTPSTAGGPDPGRANRTAAERPGETQEG